MLHSSVKIYQPLDKILEMRAYKSEIPDMTARHNKQGSKVTRLVSNPQRVLLSAEIKGMHCHHTQLPNSVFKIINYCVNMCVCGEQESTTVKMEVRGNLMEFVLIFHLVL